MNDAIKIALVHPDKQHSFKTAKALIDMGYLEQYITTVYDKPGSLTHYLTKLLTGNFKKKLQSHRSSDIPDSNVKQYTEFLSLLLLILVRIDKSKKFYSKMKIYRDKVFNKKVARYCKRNNIDAVISFDVVSAQLYKALEDCQIVKILDMSAPHFSYMCTLFEKEVEKHPSSCLKSVLKAPLFSYWKQQSEYEIKNADGFLIASDFTKNSLTLSGADESKIFKCVYGLNHDFFNAVDRTKSASDHLKCVYVGNVTEQKGSRYLFEAIKKIKDENPETEFTIVGAYNPLDPLIEDIKTSCVFTGHILPAELKKILLESDIMVFPSLADGFGFAVAEAMACGVVPICSRNAGVSDLIEDGKNGFIISAADSNSICEKINHLDSNRELLSEMSKSASEAAKQAIWDNYRQNIESAINTILKK